MERNGLVIALFIAPSTNDSMRLLDRVEAVRGCGLRGDRYCTQEGTWNKNQEGKRQVTLMDESAFAGTSCLYSDPRRNIITHHTPLEAFVQKKFWVGGVLMYGVEFCKTCRIPKRLSTGMQVFREHGHLNGGLIAQILEGGYLHVGDTIRLAE